MDFTFVPLYNGQAPKKRRLAKACETCRARKKRCYHNPIEDQGDDTDTPRSTSDSTPRKDSEGTKGLYKGISVQRGRSNRFLSDLTPETRLLERNAADGESSQAKSMVSVGTWVSKDEYESLIKQRNAAIEAGSVGQGGQTADTASSATIRPHSSQLGGLIDIYFARVHPFLPLVDEAEFRRLHADGHIPEPYAHAVCLVAAKDHSAEEFLKTSTLGPSISPRQLCRSLHASVKAAVASPVKYDKLTLIRMLALLSMHTEGPDGAEEASLHIMSAMHRCQTLGLHLSASFPDRSGKTTKRLFWCVWVLDRLTAIMNGRPILMADQDMAIESFDDGESGFPAFEILLKIMNLVNEVIGFYRPGNEPSATGWETKFPGFDEIVESVKGWTLPASVLSSLHISYLAGAILSHRSKGVADFASTTPSYVRQRLATVQIIRAMNPQRLGTLHPLPILPYAVSLALSVSYQHMRQDQLQTQQEDAKADFEACLVILRELRRYWSSVDAMYTLSQKVIDELNRVPDITSFRIKRSTKVDDQLEGFASACRHDGERIDFAPTANAPGAANEDQDTLPPAMSDNDGFIKDPGLFEGIDDIFGTYLDPNYPINLDFLEDLDPEGQWIAADDVTNNG